MNRNIKQGLSITPAIAIMLMAVIAMQAIAAQKENDNQEDTDNDSGELHYVYHKFTDNEQSPAEETMDSFDEVIEENDELPQDPEVEDRVEPENSPQDVIKLYTEEDVCMVAKTVYGEALVTRSDMEMAAVVWCILNRVDSEGYGCGTSIEYVVTFPNQFHGYNEENPVTDHIKELVIDVFERWSAEKAGVANVGRILPKEYIYFYGDGKHNHFTTEFRGGQTWDWSLENPYEN